MSYHRERLAGKFSDPDKLALIFSLPDDIISVLASSSWTAESAQALEQFPDQDEATLGMLRTIFYNNIPDYNSERGLEIQAQIDAFRADPTFVASPDFFVDETTMAAVETKKICNHSRPISEFLPRSFRSSPGMEIIGTRITDNGVEVMTLCNPSRELPDEVYGTTETYFFDATETYFFDADELLVPKNPTVGTLYKSSPHWAYGRGDELYINIQSPYPGKYGTKQHIEIVLGRMDADGVVNLIENL